MAYNFPYLKDSSFLKQFDNLHLKQQFVKLTVLTFNEQPIEEIQGKVISGSFNLDGTSSMRRTGSINLIADQYENDLTKTQSLLSINKKIQVLIGFINTTGQYTEYDMLWFPLGVYAIIAANISNTIGGINISLTLHDKMAFLNGECGGTLPASIVLNEVEDIKEDGSIEIKQIAMYNIIQQLVNHFGNEQLGKIIIADLDDKAKQVMKWIGSTPLYYALGVDEDQRPVYHFSTNYHDSGFQPGATINTFEPGDDIGYSLTELTYPGQLISKAGDTICSILDQIKNTLGNFEYFYDVNGNFIFQQIKNYLNKSYSNSIITDINNGDYQVDYTSGKSVYTFENSEIISSITNAPQFQQIKNDFIVWGKRKALSGQQVPIRYHLAIDKKPETGNSYEHIVKVTDSYGNEKYVYDEDAGTSITSNDFRTDFLLSGVSAQRFATNSNYYYTQLQNEWPKLYNVIQDDGSTPDFKEDVKKHPEDIDFFLDFIDTQADIGEYSVQNIGRRTVVINDDTINCIFAPMIPDIVIIKNNQDDTAALRTYCNNRGQDYVQMDQGMFDMLWHGGVMKSAYEQIKKQLYQYTTFNEQVSLTTLPIYYLEPNTRITIRDTATGIYGDFMIKSISLPFDINGTMNITCTKALERL